MAFHNCGECAPFTAWHPDEAVVLIVSVAVAALVPETLAGVVDPKLSVGRLLAPAGELVMAALSAMAPVKLPLGVMVMVDVLPVVAPGITVIAGPVIEKFGAGVTVIAALAMFPPYIASPEYAAVSVSLPVASEPAGIDVVAVPAASETAEEVYEPLVNVTVPVGMGCPLAPATEVVTVAAALDRMLDADGVTDIVDVAPM
jgi:hypothetical protein